MGEFIGLLKRLSEVCAPSGYEGPVKEIIESAVKDYVDEVYTDKMGNLVTVKRGVEKAPKILLDAHMDEIGMLVKYIDDKGFIRFSYTGGFSDQVVLNQRVMVLTREGSLPGVIGSKPPHLISTEDRDKPVKRSEMFIDIGVGSREEAERMGVRIGDHVTWVTAFTELADKNVSCKAFDNRVGCTVLIEVLKEFKSPATIYGVFPVMEEVGLRGAKTAAYSLEPNAALVFDIAAAGDHPGIKEGEAPIKLGGGPVIGVADGGKASLGGGLITHPKIRQVLVDTAERNNIPYQLYVFEGATTDGTAISLSRSGVPTGLLSVPVRYVHSASEVLNTADVEKTIELSKLSLLKIAELF